MFNQELVNEEYARDAKLKKRDVDELKEWLKSQPHLPEISEHEIIWFLKSCFYSNEATKVTIDNNYTMKTHTPELLGNRDVNDQALRNILDTITFCVLPQRTPEGYSVLITHLSDTNPDLFNYNEMTKALDMLTALDLYKNGTSEGALFCFDADGLKFGHVTRINLISAKKFATYLEKAMPVRLKGLHFFNVNPIVDKLLSILKPVISKEVYEKIRLHQNVQDLSKTIPLESFPEEFGGKAGSLSTLKERTKMSLIENADFFAYQDGQKVDESKRPIKPKNISDLYGIDGTFKKLDLD